ncbi:MAG: aminotransferase class III [Planctomycetota bacterium]|nr:MAG: aminotransferase class III [Planctomycetota bacterium]
MNLDKSFSLQKKASKIIPGLCQLLSKRPDMFSWGVWPGYFKKAKGCYITDLDDNEYLDMSISGIGACVLGYANDDVDDLVVEAIRNGSASSLNCKEEVDLAELLCDIHPWADMVRFSRTGGESMAIAVRIARAYTKKDKIAFCGYHGWHDWYLAANLGSEDSLDGHLLPGLNPLGVPKGLQGTAIPFKYNDFDSLQKIVLENKNEMAAIVMEPIRNEKPDDNFLQKVQQLAKENDLVFVIDEISSGFRENSGGIQLKMDFTPDIAVFSKAIGNGYPIGAIIGNSKVMSAAQDTFISSTNWTERVGYVAAIQTIKIHQKLNVGEHLIKMGMAIQNIWKLNAEKYDLNINIGGIYPLSHFSFSSQYSQELKALFIQEMLEEGILAGSIFYPSLAHDESHIEKYNVATDKAFKTCKDVLMKNNFEKVLVGKKSASGFTRLN